MVAPTSRLVRRWCMVVLVVGRVVLVVLVVRHCTFPPLHTVIYPLVNGFMHKGGTCAVFC